MEKFSFFFSPKSYSHTYLNGQFVCHEKRRNALKSTAFEICNWFDKKEEMNRKCFTVHFFLNNRRIALNWQRESFFSCFLIFL